MQLTEAIRARKSIRSYLSREVPQETIREILRDAVRAPSAMNTQPWRFYVAAGVALDEMRRENTDKFLSGVPPIPEYEYAGIYRQRKVEIGRQLFSLMGIGREDREKRSEWTQRGFRYFDAPAAIFLCAEKPLLESRYTLYDLGAVSSFICLTASEHGLGTCVESQGVMYPEVARKHLNVPDDLELIMSIAIGYPNPDFPANRVESNRTPPDELTIWCGF